jgi:hypothetical protein
MRQKEKVNIRPNVSILSMLKFLEYETWYALAEFVDNSLASYLLYEKELKQIEDKKFQLEVKIEINEAENNIVIRDNAAGIHAKDYPRAFRAAEVPPDTTGLSEFGMGMKSASCWFSDEWSVRTTALGEGVEKTVQFDMNKIFEDKIEELEVIQQTCEKNHHYTIIELHKVNKIPRKRNLGKVKSHLASIYRDFIRRGVLKLIIDTEELTFTEPKILVAPRYDDPKGKPITWKREIDFPIEDGLSVHGFVAIREKASTQEAGFALFRRGRVIQGSFEDGFRPEYLFGHSNSFRYQRIFGELHLEGFDVIFTKKGIKWDNNLDIFLNLLRDDLSHPDFPLLQQADKYRVRATEKEFKTTKKALDEAASDLEKKAEYAITETVNALKIAEPQQQDLSDTEKILRKEFEIRFNKVNWRISIELSYDPSLNDLIEIGDHLITEKTNEKSVRQIGIRLSLTHPFMIEHVGVDNSIIEPILRIVAALGLSEVLAKESGVKTQGEVRRNFNELISNLSKQE